MGILAKDNRQLILIYSKDSLLSKKLIPHVKSMDKAIRLININKENLTDTIWIELAATLKVEIGDLFTTNDRSSKDFSSHNFGTRDWLKIIRENPELLQNPIAINGEKAKIIKEKHDIFSFYNAAGANFSKAPEDIKLANHKAKA